MVITLLFTIVSILAISLLVLFHRHRSQFSGKNLPPGDIGYPVIGETYAFVSSGLKGHPENFFFDRVRKNSSHVFKTSFLGEKMAFLCGPAGNKFLFSNEEKLVKVWFPSSVEKIFPAVSETSFMDEAAKLRTILPVVLRPEALQRCFLAVVDQCTQSHFADDWENKPQVQVFPLASKYTLRLALRVFVGLEIEADIEKLSKPFYLVTAGITSMPINFPGTLFRKAIKAASLIRNDLQKIIKQRKIDLAVGKVQPTQDVLSHMLTTEEHDTYVKECAIADKILGTLVVGYHTLSVPLVFIVKYLGELPHVYDAVYKEQMEIANSKSSRELLKWDDLHKMKYSWNVAQEVMRIAPPGQGAFREAKTDFVFNGFTIPKGWKLYWSSSSTNKNPDYFPEPEKFDPSRFEGDGPAPYTFVPFGGGPRMCPGNAYARMVLLVFMHYLVKNYKLENIIPDEKITYSPFATPVNGLPVRLFRHNKSAAIST